MVQTPRFGAALLDQSQIVHQHDVSAARRPSTMGKLDTNSRRRPRRNVENVGVLRNVASLQVKLFGISLVL